MRIFVAGASGVIGRRLVPLLVEAGHTVAGTTRTPDKVGLLAELGAEPVVVDVYDAGALRDALVACEPELVMHQLTDLPDDVAELVPERLAANSRIRDEGTRNLIEAARAASADRLLVQSIAWTPPGGEEEMAAFEGAVLDAGGVVVRYGQLYGPDTYYEDDPPDHPRVHVEDAARRTLDLLDAPSGVVVVAEPES